MKVTIPEDQIDSLMTIEDFISKLESSVNTENARIINMASDQVNMVARSVLYFLQNSATLAEQFAESNPEAYKELTLNLVRAASSVTMLAQHFSTEAAMSEAINAVKH